MPRWRHSSDLKPQALLPLRLTPNGTCPVPGVGGDPAEQGAGATLPANQLPTDTVSHGHTQSRPSCAAGLLKVTNAPGQPPAGTGPHTSWRHSLLL